MSEDSQKPSWSPRTSRGVVHATPVEWRWWPCKALRNRCQDSLKMAMQFVKISKTRVHLYSVVAGKPTLHGRRVYMDAAFVRTSWCTRQHRN